MEVSSCPALHKSLHWLLSALRIKICSPLLGHQMPRSHLAPYPLVVVIHRQQTVTMSQTAPWPCPASSWHGFSVCSLHLPLPQDTHVHWRLFPVNTCSFCWSPFPQGSIPWYLCYSLKDALIAWYFPTPSFRSIHFHLCDLLCLAQYFLGEWINVGDTWLLWIQKSDPAGMQILTYVLSCLSFPKVIEGDQFHESLIRVGKKFTQSSHLPFQDSSPTLPSRSSRWWGVYPIYLGMFQGSFLDQISFHSLSLRDLAVPSLLVPCNS